MFLFLRLFPTTLAIFTQGTSIFEHSTFSSNTASSAGGAVYIAGNATFSSTLFENNRAGVGGGGAVGTGSGANLLFVGGENVFTSNVATRVSPAGNQIRIYGKEESPSTLRFDICKPGTFQPTSIPTTSDYFIENDLLPMRNLNVFDGLVKQ